MAGQVKFGLAEAVVLLTMSNMARIFMTFPRSLVELAGPAAWLTPLPGLLLALLQTFFIWLLLKPHPGKTIVDITGDVLGKVAGTLVNILYIVFFLSIGITFTRIFSEAMIIAALPRTPISVVSIGFMITAMLGAYVGVEALARSARVTYPFVLGGIVLLLASLYPLININNIFPLLGIGPYQVFVQGGLFTGVISEVLIAAVIINSLASEKLYAPAVARAMLMSFTYLLILELAFVLVIHWRAASEYTLPFYKLSGLIYLGRFFQRIEAIFIIIWGYIGMIKISITLYAASVALAGTLKLKNYRPFIWPLGLIVFIASLLPPDMPSAVILDAEYIRTYGWIPTFILPVVVLAVDRLRRGRREQ